MKNLAPAILFSVWTVAFAILFCTNGTSLLGPALTGVAAVCFWISFVLERKEKNN